MKKWTIITLFVFIALALSACTPAAPAEAVEEPVVVENPTVELEPTAVPTEEPTDVPEPTEEPVSDEPVLTLVGMNGEKSFTLAELMEMETVEGQAGIKSSTGQIYPPALYKGVSFKTLLAEIGGIDEATGLNVVAADGYGLAFSYDQIMNGNFVAYDPATGDELRNPVELDAIVAFERDGEPLDLDGDGILRVVVISEKNNQVTDGHWSIKWVNRMELNTLVQDWEVLLTGAITETLDRSSIESCVNCHEATWTDDKGQVWTGTQLWRLMGYVDDEVAHEGLSYNVEKAMEGYEVELVASDGYAVTLESKDANRNQEWVVAMSVDGNPLPEKYFPIRLVGEGLEKGQMVGAISNVNLSLEPIDPADLEAEEGETEDEGEAKDTEETAEAVQLDDAEAELVTVAVDEGELQVLGLVNAEVGLMSADLRAWNLVTLTIEHPKKGELEYEGILVNDLLAAIGVQDGATTLVLTADDGYSAEVPLADLAACMDCILEIREDGTFTTAMPAFETSTWIKGLVKLEIK